MGKACIVAIYEVNFMRIVLRVGGSIIASPVNSDLIIRYAALMKELRIKKHEIAAVVGGGALARELIDAAKNVGLDEETQDEIAISVSRIFAQFFIGKLKEIACKTVQLTVDDAATCLAGGKIAIMGGLRPGMTTDTVAALVADRIGADLLVKATDQDGVFDKDPRKHMDAVKLDRLTFEDLSRVFEESRHRAGIHQVIDPEATKILMHSRRRVVVVNGFEPMNVLKAVEGKHVGTLID